MNRNKVLILGAVPPPRGGVTIHTLRLISELSLINYPYTFKNLRPKTMNNKFSLLKYFFIMLFGLKKEEYNVIHYQLNNVFELAFLAIFILNSKNRIITTVHSFRPELYSSMKKKLFNIIKKKNIEFIAPSDTVKNLLLKEGVRNEFIKVLNTYLPPSYQEINEEIPKDIMQYIDSRDNIILANASKIYLDDKGTDVYGLDMCIEACKTIPTSNFIYCVSDIKDENYYKKCLEKITSNNLNNRFLIINKNISFVSLLKHASVFIRPTSTDSFGISVAEALYMGVPTLASDVCERPKEAQIFSARNQKELNNKIQTLLDNEETNQISYKENLINEYLDVYEKVRNKVE